MNNCTNTRATTELLSDIYKNVKAGTESITDIIPKVKDKFLLRDMTAQLDGYSQFASQAAHLLAEYGSDGAEVSAIEKITSRLNVMINTTLDSSVPGIAEMIAENSAESADTMKKRTIEAEMMNCDERASELAREIADFEMRNSGIMKEYYEK